MKDLYAESCKSLIKEIKDDFKKQIFHALELKEYCFAKYQNESATGIHVYLAKLIQLCKV